MSDMHKKIKEDAILEYFQWRNETKFTLLLFPVDLFHQGHRPKTNQADIMSQTDSQWTKSKNSLPASDQKLYFVL